MLQRRAQGATRIYLAQEKACCKLFYTTDSQPAEQQPQDGINSFISTDVSNPELEFPKCLAQEDAISLAKTSSNLQPSLQSIAVKDNIATVGSRTTCGSGILREYRSPFEAGVVRSLRLHGSLVCGKTNMDEFGMGSHSTHSFFGPVSNAWPLDKLSVGGSSGGSAAAVASGQCSVALGTDTGGSVRLPAAYTGIVGFKPSYGAISRWGVIPYANSMDTVGILASDVSSIKKAFWRIRRHDPRDPTSVADKAWDRLASGQENSFRRRKKAGMRLAPALDMFGIRIGVPLEYNIAELDSGIRQAWRNCLDMFQDRGATIVSISLPNTRHALSTYYVLAPAEAASNLSKYDGVRYGTRDGSADGSDGSLYSRTRGKGFGEEVKRRILLGSYTLSSEAVDNYFLKAQKVRRLVQQDFDRVFATPSGLRPPEQFDLKDLDESIPMSSKLGPTQVDFIVCPTAPTLPPTLDAVSKQTPVDTYMNDVFTVPASLAGIPAISIPFTLPEAFHSQGKPAFAGMQIIGQYASDNTLINIANIMMNPRRTESQGQSAETVTKEYHKQNSSKQEQNQFPPIKEENPVSEEGGLQDPFPQGDRANLRIRKIKIGFGIRKMQTKGPLIRKYFQPYREVTSKRESEHFEPLARNVPTDKGNPERLPKTDKEVSKVLEDSLGLWKLQNR
ncbi:amidase-domain-containing protein [Hyaloscypha variabilis F]|uniref:Glutamyl-tRNA(Gln) amidotransferase subunit A, mitochondrial n=1 Tax=Hyaloscypha variabilis (strain UAMH 11265 / GT02V1 / F) TaxID=1149755 RepID=A0A2J6QWV9_HYAVF|nr:amidase-domain-containing protein [Hyaloscypha variabilis F]